MAKIKPTKYARVKAPKKAVKPAIEQARRPAPPPGRVMRDRTKYRREDQRPEDLEGDAPE